MKVNTIKTVRSIIQFINIHELSWSAVTENCLADCFFAYMPT